jgi:hypothetical protein
MNALDNIFNQVIIVQTSYQPTPHLETDMEVIERLLEQNNTIYWLICNKSFKVCFNNPTNEKWTCTVCVSRVKNGVNEVKKNLKNKENLKIIEYSDYEHFESIIKKSKLQFYFKSFLELKKYTFNNYDVGMATASSLVSYTRNHLPKIEVHSKFIEDAIKTGVYLYETFEKITEEIQPNLVILFNGRFIENRPILRVCQKNNISYVTLERGGKLNTFLFRVNSIPHSIETISEEMNFFWENATNNKEEIGNNFFNNRIKRVEDAWYSFTKEQQNGRLPESFKNIREKKVITIFNSSLDEYEGLEGFGPFFYENDNIGIKKITESLVSFSDIKLYLRVHPNLKGLDNEQNNYIKNKIKPFENIEIIEADDSVDTYELINKSDIIIVFNSTVGAEAIFANKKVILLGRAAYENLDSILIPKSHDELIEMLVSNKYQFPRINREDALKFGYWNENLGMQFTKYEPINIAKGMYKGKKIKANFIYRELKRLFNRK